MLEKIYVCKGRAKKQNYREKAIIMLITLCYIILSKTTSILIKKGRIFLFLYLIMLSCVTKLLR